MDLRAVLSSNGIKVRKCRIEDERNYYDVDYYDGAKEKDGNIVYFARHDIEPGLTLVSDIELNHRGNFYLVEGSLEEAFKALHRHFLSEDKKWLMAEPFVSLFLSEGGHDIKRLAAKAAEIFHNPVIITDAAYKVLAINDAGSEVDDPIFEEAFRTGYCSEKSISRFEEEGVTEKVLHTSRAFLLTTGLASKIHRILAKISIRGKVVAYLGILEVNRPLTLEDLKAAELLVGILQRLFEGDAYLLRTTNIIYESLLDELLAGNIRDPLILKERLKAARWKAKSRFRTSVIPTFDERQSIDNIPYLASTISDTLGVKVIRYENNILVLHDYEMDEEWHRQIDFVAEKARGFALKVGISDEFSSLLELRRHYDEALKAVDIALLLGAKDTAFYFAAFLPFYLMSLVGEEKLHNCHNVYYERLRAYDDKHHSGYLETLYYYVLFNCNVQSAAERLHVHRNTLAHRLERIEEITNLPMGNGIVLQNFVLFYQIQLYLRKSGNQKALK